MRRFLVLLNGLDGSSLFWAMRAQKDNEPTVINDHDGSYLMRAIGLGDVA